MYYEYERFGYTNDYSAFKGSEIVTANREKVQIGDSANHLLKEGSLKNWSNVVEKYVIGKLIAETVFVSAFAAPIVELLGRDNILLNVCGETSIGKTTISKLCTSVFSSKDDKRLVQSWDSTEKALVEFVKGKRAIIIVIEDASLMDDTIKKNVRGLMYRLKDGNGRLRCGKGGKLDNLNDKSRTVILMNSEISIVQLIAEDGKEHNGVFGRLIEIPVMPNDFTQSAKEANAIENCLNRNYGLAGNKFIKYLYEVGFDSKRLKELYDAELAKVKRRIDTKNNIMCRLAEDIAVISMTAWCVADCFGYDMNYNEIRDNLIEICKENIEKYVFQSNIGKKVINNSELYQSLLNSYEDLDGFKKEHNKTECICIKIGKVEEFVTENGGRYNSFTKFLKDKNLIHYRQPLKTEEMVARLDFQIIFLISTKPKCVFGVKLAI